MCATLLSQAHHLTSHELLSPGFHRLLEMLNLRPVDVPRLRDCYLTRTNPRHIAILTRMGGDNRGCWNKGVRRGGHSSEVVLTDKDCNRCVGCKLKKTLEGHPLYVCDYDARYNSSYAIHLFEIPVSADISGIKPPLLTPMQRLRALEVKHS